MTAISAPMAQTMGRINEIRARFEPPTPAPATTTSTKGFSSVLASSLDTSGGSGLSSLLVGSGSGSSIDLSTLGGSSALGSGSSNDSAGIPSWASGLTSLDRATLAARIAAANGSPTGGASATSVTGDDIVADAKQYLGIPYKWGGTDPTKGLDCSALVQRAYGDLGINLPRVSQDQAKMGTEVASLADAKPGDLVAFGQPVDHIAIYAGNGKIIQAPHTGDVVRISDVSRGITTIRRILPDTAPTASLASSTSNRSAATAAYASMAGPYGAPLSANATQGQARYQSLFDAAGAKYGISPALLASVARAESNFNPNATSSAGAVGLMQFMPTTAAGMGIDPTDPAQAIDGAARYLSTQIRNFGSVDLAVAAYNAGPGAVRKYGGIPPFTETRNYVAKVMAGIDPALAAAGRTS